MYALLLYWMLTRFFFQLKKKKKTYCNVPFLMDYTSLSSSKVSKISFTDLLLLSLTNEKFFFLPVFILYFYENHVFNFWKNCIWQWHALKSEVIVQMVNKILINPDFRTHTVSWTNQLTPVAFDSILDASLLEGYCLNRDKKRI